MGSDVSFAKLLIAKFAKVAELADALDLGSSGSRRGGSSPPFRIKQLTDSSGTRSGGPSKEPSKRGFQEPQAVLGRTSRGRGEHHVTMKKAGRATEARRCLGINFEIYRNGGIKIDELF